MIKTNDFHEVFTEREQVLVGSERAFGIVFAIVFTLIGGFPLFYGASPRYWALGIGIVFLLLGFIFPKTLRPFNLVWFKFGALLHKIINPLVMGFLFFFIVTPIALLMRLFKKDSLNRTYDHNIPSYWIIREKGEPQPDTMQRQF